jgi:fido (protein-threonine AMPylation protein)
MKNPYLNDNGTLLNRFGITDKALLSEVEYGLTTQRIYTLQENPIAGNFDLAHLKGIHKYLLGDVYAWAGQERTVNFSKRSADDLNYKGVFTQSQDIKSMADDLHLRTIAQNYLQGLNKEQFAQALAPIYADWNQVHPFPEGNGRSLQTMMAQLATKAGHELNFDKVDPDRFRDAVARSMALVHVADATLTKPSNLEPLIQVIREINTPEQIQALRLEPIRLNHYPQADRQAVQVDIVTAVQADPQGFIEKYKADPRSFDGRYVAADLFKETFDTFTSSKEAKDRYNGPVHNSAAVLASELFRQNLQDTPTLEKHQVVFVTGAPGAGKTTTVLSEGQMKHGDAMIYEGQLSNPVTTFEKLQQVLDAGYKPLIIAIHIQPEKALENAINRFETEGRGASINVMANIQGQLADSLARVQERFGNQVDLQIQDKRDPIADKALIGWHNLDILRSEGNHEQITDRLNQHLSRLRESGSISTEAYRQASSGRLADTPRTSRELDGNQREPHEDRSGISGRDR